ncbi:hypothetical protein ACFRAE_08345 [Sphingobacterium sp. HJSM2_6]|uniref:hypothetical protein n=1 Tax=Sphingobacterium sp. HJSM2_6 TaxID=3366264 RepID=UPI003BCF9CC9
MSIFTKRTGYLLLFVIPTFFFLACKKDLSLIKSTEIQISMLGTELTSEDLKRSSIRPNSLSANQGVEIPIGDNQYIQAELIQETSNKSLNRAAIVNSTNGLTITPLKKGVKYRVVIYQKNGTYLMQDVFTVGSEILNPAIKLTVGLEYTFIVYSFGNTTDPGPAPTSSLSTSTISSYNSTINGWLHFSKNMIINENNNVLPIVLKNKFSQIKVNINSAEIGNISAINSFISNHRNSIYSVKLMDGSFTIIDVNNNANITFAELDKPIIESALRYVCTKSTEDNVYSINSITIDGVTKSNIHVSGFKLLPGYKYILNLTFKGTGGIEVGNVIWATGNLTYQNGIYYNRKYPEETGFNYGYTDYWNFASHEPELLPAMNISHPDPTSPKIEYPIADPCKKISGGKWRMPTLRDFELLGAPIIVDASGNVGHFTGIQANGLGNSATGTKNNAGYIYFNGKNEVGAAANKLKFFAGGGLRGLVFNNIPVSIIPNSEGGNVTVRNFDAVYLASDSQNPSPSTGRDGIPLELKDYVFAPPTFLALNENSDKRFNFLSHRTVYLDGVTSDVRPRRDHRYPIRCVKDKL